MFTGLIQEVGKVEHVETQQNGRRIRVYAPETVGRLIVGGSVAIDGACMTAVRLYEKSFEFELSHESLSKTTFARLSFGQPVNLELPLLPTSPLGGHYVTGHVDGCLEVLAVEEVGMSWVYTVALPEDAEAKKLFVPKGSVALNGISLTVNEVRADAFTCCIIPHTMEYTNLKQFKAGDALHYEGDILGKYVQRQLEGHLAALTP